MGAYYTNAQSKQQYTHGYTKHTDKSPKSLNILNNQAR
jgi:hypothetical protein